MKLAPRPTLTLLYDAEANGLLEYGQPLATKAHCLVVKCLEDNKIHSFVGYDEINKGLDYMSKATTLIAHNQIDYDLELFRRLHNWKPNPKTILIDTLIMSRVLNPDRAHVEGVRGPHSVEAWGKRLGRWKPEINDWSTFTPEMLHRCVEDVEIQHLIYLALLDEAGVTDRSANIFQAKAYKGSIISWAKAFEVEHKSFQLMRDQQTTGVGFAYDRAVEYCKQLDHIIHTVENEITRNIPSKPKQKGVSILEPFLKTGGYKKAVVDWYPHLNDPLTYKNMLDCTYDVKVSGPFSRVEWFSINLNSDKQIKEWLYSLGWEPDEWNYKDGEYNPDGTKVKTSPKVTDSSVEKIDPNLAEQISLRSKASHKRNQIQGWIDKTRPDGRIEAGANAYGANTGRMQHRSVANVTKASSDKKTGELIWYPDKQPFFFGTEQRSLFEAQNYPDYVLIGRDAAGLELRCLAHYMNDPEFTEVILNGDIHEFNRVLAGLDTRDQAKTFIYAWLYGAGAVKIGSIVLPDGTTAQQKAAGEQLKMQFVANLPALGKLLKDVKKASQRGWLKGLDGRKLMMRSFQGNIQTHKALNTLLQGAGVTVMTYARVWLAEEIIKNKLTPFTRKVLDYHDEETYETLFSHSLPVAKLMVDSVVQSGKILKLNIPLDAEAKVGRSWAQIH